MYPFTYEVSLRVRHKKIAAAEITRELDLEAKHCWSVGDRNPMSSGIRSESYWTHRFRHSEGIMLNVFLQNIISELSARQRFLEKLVLTGGTVELFIGWFLGSNSGETFDWRLLEKLGDLRINLSFDFYSKEDSDATRGP